MPEKKTIRPFHLTSAEERIMTILWSNKEPMSQLQIIEAAAEKGELTWKERSIFSMLNSLMEKGAIVADGFVRSGKTYARTFTATVSHAEFCANYVLSSLSDEELLEFEQIMREKRKV